MLKKYPILNLSPAFKEFSAWREHYPFAFFLVDQLRPKNIVELGVFNGGSFFAFCQAVDHLGMKSKCFGVDTWQGDKSMGSYDDNRYEEAHEYLVNNYFMFAEFIKDTFDNALDKFKDKSIDLLHIDGAHSFEAVSHDFNTWLPKMSDRGVILFHDTQEKGEEFGVWRLWDQISKEYLSMEFYHGHGLGVLCVGEKVPKRLKDFIEREEYHKYARDVFFMLGNVYD